MNSIPIRGHTMFWGVDADGYGVVEWLKVELHGHIWCRVCKIYHAE